MDLPDIDLVIIGVNSESTLLECVQSVQSSTYPKDKIHIVYVDGGSTDRSVQVAQGLPRVEVIALNMEHPTPGAGRNAGWRQGHSEFIQFLDSDTVLDAEWLVHAVQAMQPGVSAVCGRRDERFVHKTVYNWIASLEWNGPEGDSEAFGGDVLIRREMLEKTQGYDEILVGGEDPELSQRVRRLGGHILCLDRRMTTHDIHMTRIRQYLKRAFRTGYGYAAVTFRHVGAVQGFFFAELRRIIIRGGGSLACCGLGLLLGVLAHPAWLGLILLGVPLLFYPRLFSVKALARDKELSKSEAAKYAWHCSFVVWPQFLGILRYILGAMRNQPLQNRIKN